MNVLFEVYDNHGLIHDYWESTVFSAEELEIVKKFIAECREFSRMKVEVFTEDEVAE